MDAASGQNGLRVLSLPVGLATRTERDSPGSVEPDAAWSGAEPGSGAGRLEADCGPSGLVGQG